MKKLVPTKYVSCLILGCGGLGLALRWLLYATCVDTLGLLKSGNFLIPALWILTVLAAGFLAVQVFPLDGSNRYGDNFPASIPGAAGAFLAAMGILITVLGGPALPPDALTQVWRVLGILAALSLVVAGICRLKGKRPFFGFHGIVCVFFVLHLANQYRVWSGNPQTQDYSFQLYACIFMMLSAYYHTAFDVGLGRRRAQLFTGLMGTFLCCLCLIACDSPLLYLGCGAWLFTNLCSLTPPPRRRRTQASQGSESGESVEPPEPDTPYGEVT